MHAVDRCFQKTWNEVFKENSSLQTGILITALVISILVAFAILPGEFGIIGHFTGDVYFTPIVNALTLPGVIALTGFGVLGGLSALSITIYLVVRYIRNMPPKEGTLVEIAKDDEQDRCMHVRKGYYQIFRIKDATDSDNKFLLFSNLDGGMFSDDQHYFESYASARDYVCKNLAGSEIKPQPL